MTLQLADANRAIAAALAKAKQLDVAVSVSICDPSGRLIAHQRMDGVFAMASRVGKAVAAAETGSPSEDNLSEITRHMHTANVTDAGGPHIRRRGGLPIIRWGKLEGAVGVSGAHTNDQDQECARAAVDSLRTES
ncbi:GlcG/HbpS family heme-binding protein [Bradyrhizobium cenepequi]